MIWCFIDQLVELVGRSGGPGLELQVRLRLGCCSGPGPPDSLGHSILPRNPVYCCVFIYIFNDFIRFLLLLTDFISFPVLSCMLDDNCIHLLILILVIVC